MMRPLCGTPAALDNLPRLHPRSSAALHSSSSKLFSFRHSSCTSTYRFLSLTQASSLPPSSLPPPPLLLLPALTMSSSAFLPTLPLSLRPPSLLSTVPTRTCIPPSTPHCSLPTPTLLSRTARAATALTAAAALSAALHLIPPPPPSFAAGSMRLPPIDRSNPRRCTPSSSAIGQANAARDSLLDLRECDLRGRNLKAFDLSGGIFSGADLAGASLADAQLSKSYAPNASFRGADFTNAIADRVTFDGADMRDVIFANAVLSDSTFENANLENVDFTDVYIGDFAQKSICRNPTVKGTNPVTGAPTRESLGCR